MLLQIELFHTFLWLNNIPLYTCTTSFFFFYYYFLIDISPIQFFFFIHFCFNGCLGCFYVLAIVYSDAMSIGVHVSFQVMVFSG